LLGGVAEGIEDRPRQALLLDPPFAATAVECRAPAKWFSLCLNSGSTSFHAQPSLPCAAQPS
jgi:hypothetical protein